MSQCLQDARVSSAPKRKFAFKVKPISAPSNNPTIGTKTGNLGENEDSKQHSSNDGSSAAKDIDTSIPYDQVSTPDKDSGLHSVRLKGSVSPVSTAIDISDKESEWHIEPSPLNPLNEHNSAVVTKIKGCIIDISQRATNEISLAKTQIFAASKSLIISGVVSGSVFLSESEGCILVATCGQMRLHNCKNCVVYLHCTSNPVIEGCEGIKFAPLPAVFVSTLPFKLPFPDQIVV